MKQHPVPQHIASYQFHLIGQMTLKQFLELAGGIVCGWLIYSMNIATLIKWPLVALAAFSGIALAFLPLEERTLDKWLFNFLKAVYSPTQYVWRKSPQLPDILNKPLATTTTRTLLPSKTVVKNELGLKEYLATIPTTISNIAIEEKQNVHLQQISSLLGANNKIGLNPIMSPITPSISQTATPTSITSAFIKTTKPLPPTRPLIRPAPPLTPPLLVESTIPHKLDPAIAAQFSTTLPIPTTPTVANLVVGMVLNDLGKIIPNALIEILDTRGETVRALKTNRLGQFFCASPLAQGQYRLKVEHPEFEFAIMEFKAENKIIPPIKISAQKRKEGL